MSVLHKGALRRWQVRRLPLVSKEPSSSKIWILRIFRSFSTEPDQKKFVLLHIFGISIILSLLFIPSMSPEVLMRLFLPSLRNLNFKVDQLCQKKPKFSTLFHDLFWTTIQNCVMILNQNYLSDEIGGQYITYSHFYNDGMSTIYSLIAWNTFSIERKSKLKLSKWNEKMYSNRFHEFLKYAKWSYRVLDLLCNLMVIFWIPFFQDFKIFFDGFLNLDFIWSTHISMNFLYFNKRNTSVFYWFPIKIRHIFPWTTINRRKKISSIVFSFLWFPSNLNTAF